ncbi:acyltransferase family protein [Daejeonella lutea]|uniref:Peptidoglycan/LPS O-acetylase OafA/YrhL, contains acyltransferase and SGNH-hydrolase domains n=1 Tax=Daejeonella lutea TaxID=572036 RepID=A0A1T5BEP0_9SPHI|nr:acyltransferase [Daejeonella lutea]SKB45499.1 Peptidoglycan/LPS O-acetylase OafA/YrhL, contains acyltransferase and SGNH-hydrolase domains [Daejeonella lutea]
MKFTLIQVFRGIAAMLVVMHHLIANSKSHLNYIPYNNFFNWGFVGVDFFFVLSGFIITYVHFDDLKSDGINSWNFFKKRFIRIYPIYWIIAILFVAVYFINTPQFMVDEGLTMDFTSPPVVKMLTESFLLLPNPDIRLVGVAWTLSYEMLFYIVFGICITYGFGFSRIIAALWVCLILLYTWAKTPGGIYPDFFFNILILEFLMGCMVAYFIRSKVVVPAKYIMPLLVILLILLTQTMHINGLVFFRDIVTVTLMGLFFSLITYLAVRFDQTNTSVKFPAFLILIGDASYSIYLSHNMLLSALTRIYALINPQSSGKEFLPVVVTFIFLLAVFIGVLIHLYVEKKLLRYFNRKFFPQKGRVTANAMA